MDRHPVARWYRKWANHIAKPSGMRVKPNRRAREGPRPAARPRRDETALQSLARNHGTAINPRMKKPVVTGRVE
jgi:hypothetical protein